MDGRCHIRLREMGPRSLLADLKPVFTDAPDGCPDPAATARWLGRLGRDPVQPPLVCVENTHIFRGGRIVRPERMSALRAALAGSGARLHLDGSRLFHAAAVLNVSPRQLAEGADTVMISLVKGLGIPAGAMLAGPRDFVRQARQLRTAVGGTLRQTGWIAAAALVALRDGFGHLKDDHRRALALAQKCRDGGVLLEPDEIDSNVILFDSTQLGLTGAEFASLALARGLRVALLGPTTVRFITSPKVDDEDVERAGTMLQEIAAERRGRH
jgi:threonine aldolase